MDYIGRKMDQINDIIDRIELYGLDTTSCQWGLLRARLDELDGLLNQ